MGVFRLESFYESNCSPKLVKIQTILEEYRKENNYVETATVVVDGTNCLRALYGDLEWICGGQLKEFNERVKKLVEKFKEMNVKLVFFFDGPTVEKKRPKWVERRLKTMNDCKRIFYSLENHRYVKSELFILPPGVGNVARIFLQAEFDCEVHTSVKENDEEISHYAAKNNCFGILAQDTDFIIYKGAKYYFSMKKLNLNTMETIIYSREKLAETLDIKEEHLPLFATLSGNDIVPRNVVQTFHQKISKKNHYNQQLDIAKYVKSLEIEGELTDEIYKKIAIDILEKKTKSKESLKKVEDKKSDDKKSSEKKKEEVEEKKKEEGEEKKKEDGEKKDDGEEEEEKKKKEDGEGGGGGDAENMETEKVTDDVEKSEKTGAGDEKMEVDGEKVEKIAENGEKKPEEENFESSEENLKKITELMSLLKSGVESYSTDRPVVNDITIDELVADLPGDCEEWKKILTVALERHRAASATTHIWAILSGGPMELSCCLEDFYKKDLPVGAELSQTLRRRIYGILLKEKPLPENQTAHKVLEWCVDRSFKNNPQAKYLEAWPPKVCDHPGLLAFWNSSPDDEDINNKRWSLFVRTISSNIDINEVKKLKPYLVMPTMALKYMVENLGYYHDFEIKTLVALALRVKQSTAEQLANTKLDRLLERPARLASLYMRIQGFLVFLISTLNGPVSLTEAMPWNNFDGKMFQFLYSRSSSNCSDSFLCNKDDKMLEQYNTVVKLVLPIKQRVNHW